MSPPNYADQIDESSNNAFPDFMEQDDVLGGSVVSQQPLPEYHQIGPHHLEVVRQALEDRAEYDKPEDSIYFVPRGKPSADHIDELRRHRVNHFRDSAPAELTQAQYDLLRAYFQAIQQGAWDIVQRLLQSGLVEANTTGAREENGCTALMMAVKAKHKQVIILLLENGALIDGWSGLTWLGSSKVIRTPLMLAASQGDLPTIKWLMEGYGADDAVLAPDGQLALRLAAEAGHEHVVAYLPTRRGGIYLRWKAKQAKHVLRIRRTIEYMGWFVKAVIYDVPKCLILGLVVYPVRQCIKWCWKNKHFLLPFVQRQITQLPGKTKRMIQRMASWILKLPTKISIAAERIWQALRCWPGAIKRFITCIPQALQIAWTYIMEGAQAVWNAVKQVLERGFSLLHTVISAIVTFFRHLTFSNLITAVADLLEAIFVSFPVTVWNLVEKGWEAGCSIMEHFFGFAGMILWCLGYGLFRMVIFLPEQLFRVVGVFGEMIAVSWKEMRVWWNPKAI